MQVRSSQCFCIFFEEATFAKPHLLVQEWGEVGPSSAGVTWDSPMLPASPSLSALPVRTHVTTPLSPACASHHRQPGLPGHLSRPCTSPRGLLSSAVPALGLHGAHTVISDMRCFPIWAVNVPCLVLALLETRSPRTYCSSGSPAGWLRCSPLTPYHAWRRGSALHVVSVPVPLLPRARALNPESVPAPHLLSPSCAPGLF